MRVIVRLVAASRSPSPVVVAKTIIATLYGADAVPSSNPAAPPAG
ncbi:hypothetical protein [Microbacterium sp. A93]